MSLLIPFPNYMLMLCLPLHEKLNSFFIRKLESEIRLGYAYMKNKIRVCLVCLRYVIGKINYKLKHCLMG